MVASCHFFLELTPSHDRNMEVREIAKNILKIKIGNTTFTVEDKNAEISTITPAETLKK